MSLFIAEFRKVRPKKQAGDASEGALPLQVSCPVCARILDMLLIRSNNLSGNQAHTWAGYSAWRDDYLVDSRRSSSCRYRREESVYLFHSPDHSL